MKKQLEMFDGDAPARAPPTVRDDSATRALVAAHRVRTGKTPTPRRRRDGRSELFCPSCGSRIALDLARELAR